MKDAREYCQESHEISRLWRLACNYWRRPTELKQGALQRALDNWPHREDRPDFYDDER